MSPDFRTHSICPSLRDFAKGDASKAAHNDVLAEASIVAFDVVPHGLVGVFYERLVEQAALGKVFLDLAFDDLVDHVGFFAVCQSLFAEFSRYALFFPRPGSRRPKHTAELRLRYAATGPSRGS